MFLCLSILPRPTFSLSFFYTPIIRLLPIAATTTTTTTITCTALGVLHLFGFGTDKTCTDKFKFANSKVFNFSQFLSFQKIYIILISVFKIDLLRHNILGMSFSFTSLISSSKDGSPDSKRIFLIGVVLKAYRLFRIA